MKIQLKSFIVFVTLFFSLQSNAVNITIIESVSGGWWAVQDSIWKDVATGMGHNATIVTQSTLDTISNLSTTDVLIVSSGTITYAGTNRLQTIIQYVLSGRPAYIQSEYLGVYQGTVAFDSVMQTVGANFTWTGSVGGQLVPMNIFGTFATTPNNVSTLNFFNFGQAGNGTGVEKFLEFQGDFFGFCYTDSTCTNGTVITTSDQDWVWHNSSPDLLENILIRLVNSCETSVHESANNGTLLNAAPNPFNEYTLIRFSNYQNNIFQIKLIDASGRIMRNYDTSQSKLLLDVSEIEKGIYFVCLVNSATGEKHTIKLIKT